MLGKNLARQENEGGAGRRPNSKLGGQNGFDIKFNAVPAVPWLRHSWRTDLRSMYKDQGRFPSATKTHIKSEELWQNLTRFRALGAWPGKN